MNPVISLFFDDRTPMEECKQRSTKEPHLSAPCEGQRAFTTQSSVESVSSATHLVPKVLWTRMLAPEFAKPRVWDASRELWIGYMYKSKRLIIFQCGPEITSQVQPPSSLSSFLREMLSLCPSIIAKPFTPRLVAAISISSLLFQDKHNKQSFSLTFHLSSSKSQR